MKKLFFLFTIIFSVTTMAQTKMDMSLDEMLRQSPKRFESIKGGKTVKDDYGFGGDNYTVTRCVDSASKCVLQQSSYQATLKIRIGADKVGWEEAERLFNEWHAKILTIKEWGKTAQTYGNRSDHSYMSEFNADRNVDGWEKYKNISIQLRTYYFSDTEFQVVLTVTD